MPTALCPSVGTRPGAPHGPVQQWCDLGSSILPCQRPAGIRPVQFVLAAGEQPVPGLCFQLSLHYCDQCHTVTLQIQPKAVWEWSWRAGNWQGRDLPACVSLSGSDLLWGQQSQPSTARAMHARGTSFFPAYPKSPCLHPAMS